MNKRAAFFTIDAIFALVICLLIVGFVYSSLSHTQKIDYSSSQNTKIANEVLENLEKSYLLNNFVVTADTSQINNSLVYSIPKHLCHDLSIWNNGTLYSQISDGCINDKNTVSYRSFQSNGEIYYARLMIYYD